MRKSLKPKTKKIKSVFHDEDLAQFGDLYFPETKENKENINLKKLRNQSYNK